MNAIIIIFRNRDIGIITLIIREDIATKSFVIFEREVREFIHAPASVQDGIAGNIHRESRLLGAFGIEIPPGKDEARF